MARNSLAPKPRNFLSLIDSHMPESDKRELATHVDPQLYAQSVAEKLRDTGRGLDVIRQELPRFWNEDQSEGLRNVVGAVVPQDLTDVGLMLATGPMGKAARIAGAGLVGASYSPEAEAGLLGVAKKIPKWFDSILRNRALTDADYAKLTPAMRQELAQARAALPRSEGGLDLPIGNTYVDRSNAMNAVDVFHGTADEVKRIDPKKFGSSTGSESAKRAFWTADDPKTANTYANYAAMDAPVKRILEQADKAEKVGNLDKYEELLQAAESLESDISNNILRGQNIMPLRVMSQNPRVVDAKVENFAGFEGDINGLLRQSARQKNDALVIQNLDDAAGRVDMPATHYGILQPNIVRSRFAAFDPFRRDSSDILAGVGAGGLGFNMMDTDEIKDKLKKKLKEKKK